MVGRGVGEVTRRLGKRKDEEEEDMRYSRRGWGKRERNK